MVDSSDGYLADLNLQTGQTNWQYAVPYGPPNYEGGFGTDAALSPNGVIYIVDQNYNGQGVNQGTGALDSAVSRILLKS
jgi:hypothetical protein